MFYGAYDIYEIDRKAFFLAFSVRCNWENLEKYYFYLPRLPNIKDLIDIDRCEEFRLKFHAVLQRVGKFSFLPRESKKIESSKSESFTSLFSWSENNFHYSTLRGCT